MKLWVDVENSVGSRTGDGPITTARSWEQTECLDRAGTIRLDIPPQDRRAALTSQRRVLRAYGMINQAVTELGAGIIDKRSIRASSTERASLMLEGDNLLRELTYRTVGDLLIDDGAGAADVTGPADIIALAPTGWSLDTTEGYASTIKAIYHQFEGELVLDALVRLAAMTGEHFRLGSGRTVVWMRRAGSAKLLLLYDNGLTLGETITGATSGATGTVMEITSLYLYVESVNGIFLTNEIVTGSTSSQDAFVTTAYNPESGIRAIQGAASVRIEDDTTACLITDLEQVQDTYASYVGRVYAIGVGNADSRMTIETTAKSWSGWTVGSDSKGYYLQHDATWLAYGIERMMVWKDIADADTLAEAAYEWMLTHLSAQQAYRLSVTKLDAALNVGQYIRVMYQEYRDGYAAVDINTLLMVLEKRTAVDANGLRVTQLTVSTIDRWPETESSTILGAITNSQNYYQHSQPMDGTAISVIDQLTITRGLVVNESGGDNDTRFESQWDPNMFFLDASASRIGLLTNDPHATLDVRGDVIINEDGGAYNTRIEGDSQQNLVYVHATKNNVGIGLIPMAGVTLHVGGVAKIDDQLVVDRSTILNHDRSAIGNTQIRGYTNNNLLYAKAAADKIGIGHNDPKAILDVHGNASEVTAIFQASATTPGNIIEVKSAVPATLAYISATGEVVIPQDSKALKLGAGVDMSMYYDGTSGYIKADLVAASDLHVSCGTDKTLVLDEPVYDDLQFAITAGKVPAANAPTWEMFTTNTAEYAFGVDDYIDLQCNEPPHGWVEGTNGDLHLHFTIKTAQGTGSDRFTKFSCWVAYVDTGEQWVEQAVLSAEKTIPTGSGALTAFYLDMGDVTLTNYKIGSQIKARVKRIAATGGTEYADDVYITQVGMHLQKERMGSRTESAV